MVPPFVVLPGLLSDLIIWPHSSIAQLHRFLLLDQIKVLMQPIQEEQQKLL